jgi:PAS domain S-box-containing protein
METDLQIARNGLESSINGILFTNKERKIIYVNQAFVKMFGYEDKKEIVGMDIREFSVMGQYPKEMEMSFEKENNWEGEVKGIRKDKSLFHAKLSASFIRDAEGKVLCLMGSLIDITETKQHENEIKEQNKLLSEKNIALKELMEQIRKENENQEKRIQANVNRLVLPMIIQIKKYHDKKGTKYIEMIEENLKHITSGFGQTITSQMYSLSKREIELCSMIKSGMTSKEIAENLNINERTVCVHRNQIRKKLGILNKKINLTTYLCSAS